MNEKTKQNEASAQVVANGLRRQRNPVATPFDGSDGLFARISHYDSLWSSWQKVHANNGGAGGDGMTVEAFSRRAENHVSRLSHDLRLGRYIPGPARRAWIPKASGGARPLDIPCVIDRVAQGSAALALSDLLEPSFNDASFAYRPGRSVADAVARVMKHRRDGYEWVVDGDIVRFFERVPHEPLLERLDKVANDPALSDLVAMWLEFAAPHGMGLPQGSPLSPLLANFWLDNVDDAIAGQGLRLVRFADDFVLLARQEATAQQGLSRMTALLREHGLEINQEKTRIVPFEHGFRFLGHVFVRSMVWKEVFDDTPREDAIAAAEAAIALARKEEAQARNEAEITAEADTPESQWRAVRTRVLYLVEPGRCLRGEGECFVVEEDGRRIRALQHRLVDRIEVREDIAVDISAFDLAAASDTEIVRVDGYGRTLGRWTDVRPARARRQFAQAAFLANPHMRNRLAQTLAHARAYNQRQFLKRRANAGGHDEELAAALVAMRSPLRMLARGRLEADTARGYEGEAASIFWKALERLAPEWAYSGKRRRRAGYDAFNILVDMLASLLARDVRVALDRAGLHTGFGALHETQDGEDALAGLLPVSWTGS